MLSAAHGKQHNSVKEATIEESPMQWEKHPNLLVDANEHTAQCFMVFLLRDASKNATSKCILSDAM